MAYTDIDNPELYFQTKLYTGTGSSNAITLDGSENMQPDWVWIKCRDDSHNHQVFDSVRGVHKRMRTDTIGAETESSESLKSFDSDGFTLGTQANVNASASGDNSFVAWNWKAGTSFSNDASATGIGSLDSSGSVNDTAGFSIVSYTGNSTVSTIKHGLSTTPSAIILKGRIADRNWIVGHQSEGWGKSASMDGNGTFSSQTHWNNTAPTNSVFTIEGGSNSNVNTNSAGYITYCFSEKKGFSKFGTYTGNGQANDGTFVYTGFAPAWLMLKRADSTSQWCIIDNKRPGYNIAVNTLFANLSDVEATDLGVNLLSNGFKEDTTNNLGASGGTYIYMAFAESPFVNSNGVPNNAK